MQIERSHNFIRAMQVLPMLESLYGLYPEFQHWYVNKVIPGLVLGHDILLVAHEGNSVAGVALGKRTSKETKLRCVRVRPEYQNTGVGLRLIDRMLEELEYDKPHCSVAEEMFHTYSRAFVNRYGFRLSSVGKGTYRRGKLEYFFN